jgi:hypothetical protein
LLLTAQDVAAHAASIGAEEYFRPEALELIRRVKHKSELTDDEIFLLAITAGQAALAAYVEPGERGTDAAKKTLDAILYLLDHDEVVQATLKELHKLVQLENRRNLPPDRT